MKAANCKSLCSFQGRLLCICVFLFLVDRLAKLFRPEFTIVTRVAGRGADTIRSVYPHLLGQSPPPPAR